MFKKEKLNTSVKVKFVIFLSTAAQKKLKPLIIMEKYYNTYVFSNMYLDIVSAGSIVEETMAGPEKKERKRVVLESPAAEIVHRESSSVLYYWDKTKQKFEEIWTSD